MRRTSPSHNLLSCCRPAAAAPSYESMCLGDRLHGPMATTWLGSSLSSQCGSPPQLRGPGRTPSTLYLVASPVLHHLRSFYRALHLPSSFPPRPRTELKWSAELVLANNEGPGGLPCRQTAGGQQVAATSCGGGGRPSSRVEQSGTRVRRGVVEAAVAGTLQRGLRPPPAPSCGS